MNNVIDIFTKKPIEKLPCDKEEAMELIKHLLDFKKGNKETLTFDSRKMLDQILTTLENNSGITAEDYKKVVGE